MAAVASERLNEVHQEARAALEQTKANYCPYCKADPKLHAEVMADEYGYCHHLLGFTDDNLKPYYEPVRPLIRHNPRGEPFDTGFKVTGGRELIPEGAELVNPLRKQEIGGITFMVNLWNSSRVYWKDAEKKPLILPAAIPLSDEALLEQEVRQLEKKLAKQALQKRRDELRKELEQKELAELDEATRPDSVLQEQPE